MGISCTGCRLSTAGFAVVAAAIVAAGVGAFGPDRDPAETEGVGTKVDATERAQEQADPAYVLKHEMKAISGKSVKLETYKGKVALVVNVASRCGLTPQYEGLEKLYRERKDDGFTILAFPANNFMGQEPGTNEEIATFCRERFDVTFPMFEKISVKGEDRHPLYEQLAKLPKPLGGEPEWNFTKFLVDREGRVVARFGPRTKPNDPKLIAAIETLLKGQTLPEVETERADG